MIVAKCDREIWQVRTLFLLILPQFFTAGEFTPIQAYTMAVDYSGQGAMTGNLIDNIGGSHTQHNVEISCDF